MLFVSLTFLFIFLPAVMGIYYLLRGHRNIQNILLFLASLFFYAWGEPVFVLVLLASIFCNWFLALLIHRSGSKPKKKLVLSLAVIINIGILFVYKYLNFFAEQVSRIQGISLSVKEIALPIGISFFTFQALSYVIDVYRGERYQRNPFYVGLYISFFPQLIAGPIVRYNTIENQIVNRVETLEGFKQGTLRFVQGFAKKVLLANTMALIADKAFALEGAGSLTVSFAWLGAIAYTLQIYFDFSGYSDMAIGLGKMFGFTFEENFNYPYIASSVTDFWRRWHISLSTWFRDYVYIPLGGSKTGKASRNYLNLFVVWLLTGIWHGANWTFILWGLFYFVLLVLEKATAFGSFIKNHIFLGHIYTLLAVVLLWVVFRADSATQAGEYIKTMFGLSGASIYSPETWVYIKENSVFLLAAIILSIDVAPRLKDRIQGKPWPGSLLGELCLGLLFVASVIYIINGTYNPFIYFHF